MIRKAFMMTLIPGHQAEYQRRHQPTWPEVEAVLREHGVQNYSIFLNRGTNQLFGYAEIESEELWQQISQTDACRRWWSYMNELMLTNSDNSPVTETLDEVFHLD
jgi:L-rhamnose mutarotase